MIFYFLLPPLGFWGLLASSAKKKMHFIWNSHQCQIWFHLSLLALLASPARTHLLKELNPNISIPKVLILSIRWIIQQAAASLDVFTQVINSLTHTTLILSQHSMGWACSGIHPHLDPETHLHLGPFWGLFLWANPKFLPPQIIDTAL